MGRQAAREKKRLKQIAITTLLNVRREAKKLKNEFGKLVHV